MVPELSPCDSPRHWRPPTVDGVLPNGAVMGRSGTSETRGDEHVRWADGAGCKWAELQITSAKSGSLELIWLYMNISELRHSQNLRCIHNQCPLQNLEHKGTTCKAVICCGDLRSQFEVRIHPFAWCTIEARLEVKTFHRSDSHHPVRRSKYAATLFTAGSLSRRY